MEKFAGIVLKKAKLVILIIIILNVISLLILIFKFNISSDLTAFLGKGFKEAQVYQEINSKYNGLDTIVLAIEKNDMISVNNLKEAYKLLADLQEVKGIKYINSFIPVKILKLPVFIDISPDNLEENYEYVKKYLKQMNSHMYNSSSGLFMITLDNCSNELTTIADIKDILKKYSYTYHFTGNKIFSFYILKYLIYIICFIIPFVIALLIFIFNLVLKDIKAAFLSIIPAGFAALWTLALIFILGESISIMTILVPVFVVVMGSADGLHFISHYIRGRGRNHENIIKTMKMVGLPMVLTTVTTIAGFLSLGFSDSSALRQMGYFASFGIGFAGLISWTFLPAVLTKIKIKGKKADIKDLALLNFFHYTLKHPKFVIFVFIIIAILFASFIPGIKVYSDQLLFFKNYTRVVKDAEYFKNNYGFANIAIIDYAMDSKKTLFDKNRKTEILNFEKNLNKIEGVSGTVSIFDIQKRIYNHSKSEFITKLIFNKMIENNLLSVNQWVYDDKDYKILVQLESGSSNTIDSILEQIKEKKNVTFTGPDYLFYRLNKMVVHDQIESILIAVVLVFILMLVFNRNIILSLKAVMPIVFTLIVFFGFLKISGFNLNIVIATISSITIGIGIDYSIHFLGGYRYADKKIDTAIDIVGVPVIANAFGLAVGISPLLFSPLKIHFYVAVCMALTMIISSFSAMILLPVLVKGRSGE